MDKFGIDIARYQGKPDFAKVKDCVSFVIVQAGFGRYASQKDVEFERNYSECKKYNIPVGAYWFSYAATPSEAKEEAKACIEVLKGKQFEYPIYYDIENAACSGDVPGKCRAFCDTLESAGYYAGVYISRSPAEQFLKNTDVVKKYTLWLAEYPTLHYNGAVDMWQNSSTGSISGINCAVDTDHCYQDFPEIIKRGGFNGYPKNPQTLDKTGYKFKDTGTGVYLLKAILRNCYKRNLNDDDVFGQGTQNAVNSILSAHGYIENGIAGNGFADLISKELERK